MFSGGADGLVLKWNLDKCKIEKCDGTSISNHKGAVLSLSIASSDDFLVSSSSDNTIEICSLLSGNCLYRVGYAGLSMPKISMSRSGKYLISSDLKSSVYLWSLSEILGDFFIHGSIVRDVAFSPDGRYLASGADDGKIKIWNLNEKKLLISLEKHSAEVFSIVFSPDGKLFASAGNDKKIVIWDTENFSVNKQINCHDDSINSISFSPDNKTIASASSDKTIQLWNVETGNRIWYSKNNEQIVYSIDFSTDGNVIASNSQDYITNFINAKTGALINSTKIHNCMGVKYHPEGKLLAVAGCTSSFHILSLSDATTINGNPTEIQGHEDISAKPIFSPSGDRLATAGWDDTARIWDVVSWENRPLWSYGGDVEGVAFSPDGLHLAFGSDDGLVHLFKDSLPFLPTELYTWLQSAQTPTVR